MLLLLVERVVAVLADEDHPVDGEGGAAQRERLPDGGVDGEAVAGGDLAGEVVRGDLVGVERGDPHPGLDPGVEEVVPLEQLGDQDVGVGERAVLGDDGGDARGNE